MIIYLVLQMRKYAKRGSHAVLFQRTHRIPGANSTTVTVLKSGTGHGEEVGVSICFFYLQFSNFPSKNFKTFAQTWEKNKIGGRWSFMLA